MCVLLLGVGGLGVWLVWCEDGVGGVAVEGFTPAKAVLYLSSTL